MDYHFFFQESVVYICNVAILYSVFFCIVYNLFKWDFIVWALFNKNNLHINVLSAWWNQTKPYKMLNVIQVVQQ